MTRLVPVFWLATLIAFALVGCGPDSELIDVEMQIYDAEVLEVGSDRALIRWKTNVPGDTRVDLALVAAGVDEASRESVSDDLYMPRLRGGGVSGIPEVTGTGADQVVDYPEARFEHVSDTRFVVGNNTLVHVVLADRLLPDRIYVATVSTLSGLGSQAREFGARLTFRTSPEGVELPEGFEELIASGGEVGGGGSDAGEIVAGP